MNLRTQARLQALARQATPKPPSPNRSGWVELSPRLGRALWVTSLLKGGRHRVVSGSRVLELPREIAILLDPSILEKAAAKGGKYIKRVPTGKFRTTKSGKPGAPIYKYYYNTLGVTRAEDFKAGTSFKHAGGHTTIHDAKDGKLVVSHSKKPGRETISHEELRTRLEAEHGETMKQEHATRSTRLRREIAAARQNNATPKQIARLLDEARRFGVPLDASDGMPPVAPASQPIKNWEEWQPRPKDVPVDFTGHPFAHWLEEQPPERFMTVTVKKVGVERGRGKDKIVYDNAKVQAQIVFGYDYGQVLADSYKALDSMPDKFIREALNAHGWEKDGTPIPIDRAVVDQALQEMRESLERRLAGPDGRETGLRPLMVDDQVINCAYVYRGDETNYTGPKSDPPSPGTIYLNAMHVHSIELEPPEHGYWKETSKGAVTRAKEILSRHLPDSKIVRYRLRPEQEWTLRVNGRELTRDDIAQALAKDGIEMKMEKAAKDSKGSQKPEPEPWDPENPLSSYADLIPDDDGVVDLGVIPPLRKEPRPGK